MQVGQGTADQTACYPCGLVAQQTWKIDLSTPQTITVVFQGGEDGRCVCGWLCACVCVCVCVCVWSLFAVSDSCIFSTSTHFFPLFLHLLS